MSNTYKDIKRDRTRLEDYLTNMMTAHNAKYQLQYIEYADDEWTVPVSLTKERIELIISDYSIKNIRLSFVITIR